MLGASQSGSMAAHSDDRDREIPSRINTLILSVKALGSVADSLVARLSPLLSPDDDSAAGGACGAIASTEVGTQLNSLDFSIQQIGRQLSNALRRLEV